MLTMMGVSPISLRLALRRGCLVMHHRLVLHELTQLRVNMSVHPPAVFFAPSQSSEENSFSLFHFRFPSVVVFPSFGNKCHSTQSNKRNCSHDSVLFYHLSMHQPEPTITGRTTLGSVCLASTMWY